MPTTLECALAFVNDGLSQSADLSSVPDIVSAQILAGSHGDIELSCSGPIAVPDLLAPGQSATALDLHQRLLEVNQNRDDQPLRRICVLYAHNYLGMSNILGIMFDRGFVTDDDPNSAPIYLDRPRQGCAVFLGSIAANRGEDERAAEALFTTVHELGHVFNLQHDQTTPNFLHSSAAGHAFDDSYYHFTPTEQSQLETCSADASVMPGGSPFGAGAATNITLPKAGRGKVPLELRIDVGRDLFWRYDPIQLEIELRSSIKGAKTIVPEMVDPSRDGFTLMIENERGERHLYRPTIQSCGLPGAIEVSDRHPYRRDLPLFGQSGGYTFEHAGLHRIWAELAWPGGRLQSNALELEIRREIDLTVHEKQYRRLATDRAVASLLFHRQDRRSGAGIHRLRRYLGVTDRAEGHGELYYSLARAMARRKHAGITSEARRSEIERLLKKSLHDSESTRFQLQRREQALGRLA